MYTCLNAADLAVGRVHTLPRKSDSVLLSELKVLKNDSMCTGRVLQMLLLVVQAVHDVHAVHSSHRCCTDAAAAAACAVECCEYVKVAVLATCGLFSSLPAVRPINTEMTWLSGQQGSTRQLLHQCKCRCIISLTWCN